MARQQINSTIGSTEYIGLPDIGIDKIAAKIDTGAYLSAIWASDIQEIDHKLSFVLFDKSFPLYSGVKIITSQYTKLRVRNSFGSLQERYGVAMNLTIADDSYKTIFTLANRSRNRYPVLIGRNLLKNRFVVDVSKKRLHSKQLEPSFGKVNQ